MYEKHLSLSSQQRLSFVFQTVQIMSVLFLLLPCVFLFPRHFHQILLPKASNLITKPLGSFLYILVLPLHLLQLVYFVAYPRKTVFVQLAVGNFWQLYPGQAYFSVDILQLLPYLMQACMAFRLFLLHLNLVFKVSQH